MKFKFWPEKHPAPEEGYDAGSQAPSDMIVGDLLMESSFEESWQFVPEEQPEEQSFEELRESSPEPEQLHLPIPLPEDGNVVRLSDVRRQKEAAEAGFDPDEMMTFTPEGDVGFADEDSYAETLSRYRREVILDGAQFTRHSINSLVEGYFNNDKD